MKNYLSIAVLALLLASCGKDQIKENPDSGTGKLVFGSVEPNGSFVPVETRADDEQEVDTDSFIITLETAGGETYGTYNFGDIKETTIDLPAGTYKVLATSPDRLPVAFEQPIFSGNKSVDIKPSLISTTTVECSIENMKVSILFDESFTNDLKDYKVVVTSDDGFLVFNEENNGKAGYFAVNPLKFEVSAKRKSDNSAVAQTFYANEVSAKKHHIVRLTTTPNGSAGIDISIDYTLDEKVIDIVIDDEDENGGDPGPGTDPQGDLQISGPGLGGEMLTITDTEANNNQAVVDVIMSTSAGFSKLIVTIESYELVEGGLLEIFGLPSVFDLCNLDQYLDEYDNIVFNLTDILGLIESKDQVKDATAFTFSVGQMVSLLTSGEDGLNGTVYEPYRDHYFHLYVEDNDGDIKDETLWVRRVKNDYTGE